MWISIHRRGSGYGANQAAAGPCQTGQMAHQARRIRDMLDGFERNNSVVTLLTVKFSCIVAEETDVGAGIVLACEGYRRSGNIHTVYASDRRIPVSQAARAVPHPTGHIENTPAEALPGCKVVTIQMQFQRLNASGSGVLEFSWDNTFKTAAVQRIGRLHFHSPSMLAQRVF